MGFEEPEFGLFSNLWHLMITRKKEKKPGKYDSVSHSSHDTRELLCVMLGDVDHLLNRNRKQYQVYPLQEKKQNILNKVHWVGLKVLGQHFKNMSTVK